MRDPTQLVKKSKNFCILRNENSENFGNTNLAAKGFPAKFWDFVQNFGCGVIHVQFFASSLDKSSALKANGFSQRLNNIQDDEGFTYEILTSVNHLEKNLIIFVFPGIFLFARNFCWTVEFHLLSSLSLTANTNKFSWLVQSCLRVWGGHFCADFGRAGTVIYSKWVNHGWKNYLDYSAGISLTCR